MKLSITLEETAANYIKVFIVQHIFRLIKVKVIVKINVARFQILQSSPSLSSLVGLLKLCNTSTVMQNLFSLL